METNVKIKVAIVDDSGHEGNYFLTLTNAVNKALNAISEGKNLKVNDEIYTVEIEGEIKTTASWDEANSLFSSDTYDLAMLDIYDQNDQEEMGYNVLETIRNNDKKNSRTTEVIMISKQPGLDLPNLELTKYIQKVSFYPADFFSRFYSRKVNIEDTVEGEWFKEMIADACKKIIERRNAQEKNDYVSAVQEVMISHFDSFIGKSSLMQEVKDKIAKVAPKEIDVLINGETGTGKDVVARTIHDWSKRSKGPFIAVNIAQINKELFDSDLFGHEQGSFSGATNFRKGKFELANGGTLFLDEIGDMSLGSAKK